MSRQSSLCFAALCLLLMLSLSCGGDDNGGTAPCQGTPGNPLVLPLDVGNSWTYGVTQTEDDETTTSERIDVVIGIEDFKIDPYACIRSIYDDGIAEPDTVEQYYAQRGQGLFLYEPFTTSEDPDSISLEIVTAINESLPWKIADFTGTECDSWELLDFSGQWETSSGPLTVEVRLTASIEERTSVTVQAGTYSDVYVEKIETRIYQKLRNPFTGSETEQTTTQRSYIKDGIGIVKETSETRFVDLGEDTPVEVLIEVETNLKSFSLVP